MAITTYLFGAGASANKLHKDAEAVLPINADLGLRIQAIEAKVQTTGILADADESLLRDWDTLVKGFNRFSQEAIGANSLDTIAHAYFSNGTPLDLIQLKAVLSVFFMIEQSVLGQYDTRYDSFITWLILGSQPSRPKMRDDIRILSWNYDYQFELGWWRHSNVSDLSQVHDEINLLPRGVQVSSDEKSFSILKLNGTVGSRSKYNQATTLDLEHRRRSTPKQMLQSILRHFAPIYLNDSSRFPAMEYAFEKDHGSDSLFKSVRKEVYPTDTLIVIGYSFPAMNEVFDLEILKSMPNLQRVNLQSPPNPESEFSRRTLNNYLSKAGHSITATAEPAVSEFLRP